jgi:predicted RNA-binding protein
MITDDDDVEELEDRFLDQKSKFEGLRDYYAKMDQFNENVYLDMISTYAEVTIAYDKLKKLGESNMSFFTLPKTLEEIQKENFLNNVAKYYF